MKIIANTHKTGNRSNNDRTSATFEIRLYATSDILGDLTVVNDIPMYMVEGDAFHALCNTIEEFSATIAKLTKEGENCGDIRITRGTVCVIEYKSSKRRLCYHSTDVPDEIFNNMLCIAMVNAYGD